MIKKYRPLIIFITIEILTVILSFFNIVNTNSILISILTLFFIVINPTIYYFLFLRNKSNFTFWFVFYSAFKIAPFIFIQKNNWFQIIFEWKKYINGVLLIILICKLFYFIKKFITQLKSKSNQSDDDYTFLSEYIQSSIRFKKLSKLISFEVCSFYYSILIWKNKRKLNNFFTTHKNSGAIAIYFGLILVSGAEALGLHIMLYHKNKILSMIFIYLHIYLLINISGQIKALFLRRHIVYDDRILLCYGLYEAININNINIKSISKFEGDFVRGKKIVKLALLGKMEPHNVFIELENEIVVNLPFGIVKSTKQLLFYVDYASEFIKNIETNKNNNL